MANVREIKNPGIFAKNAQTTVPPAPIAGTSYRDPVNGLDNIEDGWPFEQRVLSQEWNQIEFLRTSLLELIDKTGILGWNDLVDYDEGHAYVIASDGLIYSKIQDSGPDGVGAKDPVSQPTFWALAVPDVSEFATETFVTDLDDENVKKTGAQTVTGVKTFSSIIVLPSSNPTSNNQATRKKYVDDLDTANVKLSGAQNIDGVKNFTSIPEGPNANPTANNQLARKKYVDDTVSSSVTPNATETVKGKAEIATQIETNTGTDDTRFITPKKLKNTPDIFTPDADESTKGKAKIATQTQANSGTDDTTIITPKKLKNSSLIVQPQATETVKGIAEIATQTETDEGTDDQRIVTPKKLRFGFSINSGVEGHIKFPTWLGGLMIQWGRIGSIASNTEKSIFFNESYSNTVRSVNLTPFHNGDIDVELNVISVSNVGFSMRNSGSSSTLTDAFWLAIGI